MAEQTTTRDALFFALTRAWELAFYGQHLHKQVVLRYIIRCQQGPPGNEYMRLLVDRDHENLDQNQRDRLDTLLREIAATLTGSRVEDMAEWQRPL